MPFSILGLQAKAPVTRRQSRRDLEEEFSPGVTTGAGPAGRGEDCRLEGGHAMTLGVGRHVACVIVGLESVWQDVRYGLRTLAKARAFTAVAVTSLALGIGANTALFSLMNVMLLKALPVRDPQSLVEFIRIHPSGSMMTNLPYEIYSQFARDQRALSDVFAIADSDAVLRSGGAAERVTVHFVSGSFFPALGVNALIGRRIGPSDDPRQAGGRVAVLSHDFWSRKFGGDPGVLGQTVRLDAEAYTVVGVMPQGFFGVDRSRVPDFWGPLQPMSARAFVWVLGRLRPGVSIPQAHAALDPLFHNALESLGGDFKGEPEPERSAFLRQKLLINPAATGSLGLRWSYWDYSYTLKVLVGLDLLILAIACANVGNLLMSRTARRAREIGIRLATGATRIRLIRQLMTESLLLALAGGIAAMALAGGGHRLLLGFLIDNPQTVKLDYRVDNWVLVFGLIVSVGTALLFGIIPAIRATCTDARKHVKMRGARLLLAVQVGLTLVLLVFAGLFARSLRNLNITDLGLSRENLVLVDVGLSCKTPENCRSVIPRLMRRLATLPGVHNLALGGDAVYGNGGWNKTIWIEGPGETTRYTKISDNVVGPGFFGTVGIPVLAGREFGEQDDETAPPIALINQTFARRFYANENPIGKSFRDSARRYVIVGVVGDAKYGSVREQTRAMLFHPFFQQPAGPSFVLHVNAAADPSTLGSKITREILATDPDALVTNSRTLPQVLRQQLREDRMFASLAGFYALVALLLGGIGIYGMAAFRVTGRTAEIGMHMALGALPRDVLWLIMRDTQALLVAGALIGTAASLEAGHLIRDLLFGLVPWDAMTLACAIFALLATGTLASYVPARRALRVDPIAALRHE